MAFGRRHDLVGVLGDQAELKLTLIRFTLDHDRRCTLLFSEEASLSIQSHVGFPCAGIRTVAGEAVLSQDRSNIPVELNFGLGADCRNTRGEAEENGGRSLKTHESLQVFSTGSCR